MRGSAVIVRGARRLGPSLGGSTSQAGPCRCMFGLNSPAAGAVAFLVGRVKSAARVCGLRSSTRVVTLDDN